MRKGVAQSHDRRTGGDQFTGTRSIEHARLGGHDVEHSTRVSLRTNRGVSISDLRPELATQPKTKGGPEGPPRFSSARRFPPRLLLCSDGPLDLHRINRVRQIKVDRHPLLAQAE